jgi:hypothetical protein
MPVTPRGRFYTGITHLQTMRFLFTFLRIFQQKAVVYQALDAVTYQASFPGYSEPRRQALT